MVRQHGGEALAGELALRPLDEPCEGRVRIRDPPLFVEDDRVGHALDQHPKAQLRALERLLSLRDRLAHRVERARQPADLVVRVYRGARVEIAALEATHRDGEPGQRFDDLAPGDDDEEERGREREEAREAEEESPPVPVRLVLGREREPDLEARVGRPRRAPDRFAHVDEARRDRRRSVVAPRLEAER